MITEDNKKIIEELEEEDLIGQVLCYDIYGDDDPREVEKIIAKIHPGGIFLQGMDIHKIRMYTEMANRYTKIPVIVVADMEAGPGSNFDNLPTFPNPMAWGACDDPELIEKAGEIMAKVSRLSGIHWTLSPVVDINYNLNSPIVNIRAASDSPEQVIKIMGSYLRGMQKNGYLAATLKHFPGDGVDDRNQHFCTTVNSFDMPTWRKTYGKVYKKMIEDGVASVMCAHIALPAYANEGDELGAIPSIISKPLMTDLLKGELGFDGAIISDAMSMIGTAARVNLDELAVSFLKSGGDMVLFNEPEDFNLIRDALHSKKLSRERFLDAVNRVLEVKRKVRLFEGEEIIAKEIGADMDALICQFKNIAMQIAEKSIKFVRDYNGILPIMPEKGAKFLSIEKKDVKEIDTSYVSQELRTRGYEVDVVYDISHRELNDIMNEYDYILVNFFWRGIHGATMRVGWDFIMTFWRGYFMKHPRVIFTSFGDPYKLYDFPYLKTYINTFSYTEPSQRAFVKTLLGEIMPRAKNPVEFRGVFDRETE